MAFHNVEAINKGKMATVEGKEATVWFVQSKKSYVLC